MTTAPQCLTDSRALLLRYLDIHESSAYPSDLDPAEVGIVGDPAHRGGYHCGRDRLDADDYSVVESSRDRSGLTYDASALDIGDFTIRVDGRPHDMRSLAVWLVDQCQAGTPDSRDIREIIYSPDGVTVRRWDRLGRRSTGDRSHLWHIHISVHRDAIRAGRGLVPLFTRYLTDIGLIEGDDMLTTPQDNALAETWAADRALRDGTPVPKAGNYSGGPHWAVGQIQALRTELAAVRQELAELRGRTTMPVDQATLEAALRTVLGSVDNTPQG